MFRADGLRVVIVPGVSTEDCLFPDLAIDPLRDGVQIYAATGFLARGRVPDLNVGLVLRLAGCAEDLSHNASLIEVLAGQYGKEHEAILYEPARYAVCEPLIQRCRIGDLAGIAVSAYTSLYVPPKGDASGDPEVHAFSQASDADEG